MPEIQKEHAIFFFVTFITYSIGGECVLPLLMFCRGLTAELVFQMQTDTQPQGLHGSLTAIGQHHCTASRVWSKRTPHKAANTGVFYFYHDCYSYGVQSTCPFFRKNINVISLDNL